MPSGLYVLGSCAATRRNLMTLNLAMQLADRTKAGRRGRGGIGCERALIKEGGCFSLSILHRADRSVVRRFVKPVTGEDRGDTIAGFDVSTYSTGAPVLDVAAAWLDCRVSAEMPLGSHFLFIGEVVDCGGEAGDSVEVLRMEDTRMNYGG